MLNAIWAKTNSRGESLLGCCVYECDSLLDVIRKAFHTFLEKSFFALINARNHVDGFLGTAGLMSLLVMFQISG
jgi:hypothetical protein